MQNLLSFILSIMLLLTNIFPSLGNVYVKDFKKGWCIDNNGYANSGEEVERLISVVPNENQLKFNELGYYNFIHFSTNTFTGDEWGNGTEDVSVFNPTNLDTDQWCEVLSKTGSKGVIITAKHHCGFCLWDTKTTDYNVMNSPYGKDIVAELSESCKKYGLLLGIYLSPWDRHEATYGSDAYNDFYVEQLKELCTNYGDIFCFWFDGACGEGPNGKKQEYDWQRYYDVIHELQPGAVISNCGPDVRWIGNEGGEVRESEWSVIPASNVSVETVIDGSQQTEGKLPNVTEYTKDMGSREVVSKYRDLKWSPAEADVSIGGGWFYPNKPFSPLIRAKELANIYFNTVGGNASLLLNAAPDTTGRIPDNEVKTLELFTKFVTKEFENKLDFTVSALSTSGEYRDTQVSDTMKLADDEYALKLNFGSKTKVSSLVLKENISFSQRVEDFDVYTKFGNGYKRVADCTVIGSQKIVRFNVPVKTDELVIVFRQSRSNPVLSEISAYGA